MNSKYLAFNLLLKSVTTVKVPLYTIVYFISRDRKGFRSWELNQ